MFDSLFARRGLSLDRLRVLVELDDAGSIAQAAGGDPIRQSQYSRQLKELDEFFGVPLTDRKGRNLGLTPAGKELARLVREQLSALEQFADKMAQRPVQASIGAGESLINWLLIPAAGALKDRFPGLSLTFHNLRSSTIAEAVRNRDLDLGLVHAESIPRGAQKSAIGTLSFLLCVPEHFLPGPSTPETIPSLEHLPMASIVAESSIGRQIAQTLRDAGLLLRPQVQCESFISLAETLRAGTHACILPHIALRHLPASIRSFPLPMLKPLSRSICLVWMKRTIEIRAEIEQLVVALTRKNSPIRLSL